MVNSKKKYRTNMAIKNIDDVAVFIKDFTENITLGEMRAIAKDKKKLDLLVELYQELGRVLNDCDIMSKREKKDGNR